MDMPTLWGSLQNTLGSQIPTLLGALGIFVIGWLIAVSVRAGIRMALGGLQLDKRFKNLTGHDMHLEGILALSAFWVILFLTLIAVFNSLDLTVVSVPFSALTTEIFQYVPRLLSAAILGLVAWLLASIIRAAAIKALHKTSIDETLATQAKMPPLADSLAQALFWLVILLFVPAILGSLNMEGLLDPLRSMVAKVLDMLPNVFAAFIIAAIGWVLATVLRNIVSNLSHTAGLDNLGASAGLHDSTQLSRLLGILVFLAVFLPALISALDTLKIEAIARPATDMLSLMLMAIPNIVAATLILGITWLVGSFVSKLFAGLLSAIGCDALPAFINLGHAFEHTPLSTFIGRLFLFFAMLFATVEASSQLGFDQLSELISTFIHFGGDILLGGTILVIGFYLANLAHVAIDRASGANTTGLARVARYAILALVTAMGLRAMGIADDIVNLAFGLTLGAIAVAFALAFGLGGREAAGKLMDNWLGKLQRKND